jgi:uncharacterized membrane protein
MDTLGLARGLAWFSLGLGITQLAAPRTLSRLIGAGEHPALFRFLGARELASGAGLLARPRKPGWIASRVAGDAMDLALLALALARAQSPAARRRLVTATAAVAGVTALDALCARRLGAGSRVHHLCQTVTVNRPADELYRFWREQEKLPPLSAHAAPAVIVEDDVDRCLAWRSQPQADIPSLGIVRFLPAPGGRGTVVKLDMAYRLPLTAFPVQDVLRPFKQWMETGEVSTTLGQPTGRRRRSLLEGVERAGRAATR